MATAHAWLREFLAQPHESVGRRGAVCPFVEPSLRADCLRVEEWPIDDAPDVHAMVALIERMADRFKAVEWPAKNSTLHALVVILPGLTGERARILDEAQRAAKDGLVRLGMMLGQFHEVCDERAARNPEFKVSRSPVSMLALRNMAFHDILFLHSDREWFAEYARRFGRRYEWTASPDPLLASLYAEAAARWGAAA